MENPTKLLKDSIITMLFAAETRRLQTALDYIVEQHQERVRTSPMGFMYNGDYYWHSKNKMSGRLPMLAWDLNDAMSKYLKDAYTVDLDKKQISQILYQLLDLAKTPQDTRNLIPDCIVFLDSTLSKLPRTQEIEDIIQHNKRLLRQYTKILPKLKLYVVSRLMY